MELLSFFNEICRLCCVRHNESNNMISLFEGNDGGTLAAKITSFTGIKIEPQDGLPPVACMKCTQLVNRVVHFIEICQFSNKILTHLFQKYHNNLNSLPPSNTDEASVQHASHGSNVIKTLCLASSASDFRDRNQPSANGSRSLTTQHNDISQFSKSSCVTAVNNSPNTLKSVTSTVGVHENGVSTCQRAQVHAPVEERTHENQFISSGNTAVNFIPSPCFITHQSVPSNSNNLDHKLEDRSSSSGSTPGAKENSLSTTVAQHMFETNPSEKTQERCQGVLAQEPLCYAVVGHASKATSKMDMSVCPVNSNCRHSEIESVNKSDSKISQIVDGMPDCGINLLRKENTIQQPHSHDFSEVGKPLSNTESDIELCSSEKKEHNLLHNQVSVQDEQSRSVHSSRSDVTQIKSTLPLPIQNVDTVSAVTATVNLKDQICFTAVAGNAALPSVKVVSSTLNSPNSCSSTGNSHKYASPSHSASVQLIEEFKDGGTSVENISESALTIMKTATVTEKDKHLHDLTAWSSIPQNRSGKPCTHPPPPLVPITESWKSSHGVHSYISKTVGPVANVNNSNAPQISNFDNSYGKECSSTEMRVALEQQFPSRTPVTSTCTSQENHSVAKHLTHNLHSNIKTTKRIMSQGKTSASAAHIPASTSKMLLNPSEVSEIVRAIGSELGVFLENDDTVGNISQAPDYSASETRVTTEYSSPQVRRDFATPYQTSRPAMLQAQRDVPFSTGQSISIPLSHRDINKQPQTSFLLPQQQFPPIVTSTNYISTAPYCVPSDYHRIPSRQGTPVNKHTKHRKKLPEKEYTNRQKRQKFSPRSKSCTSRQTRKETKHGYLLEDNLSSLLASIKVAFPDMKIPTEEELKSKVINSDQEKQFALSDIQGFSMLKTSKIFGKELQSIEASGVEKEAKKQKCPELSAPESNTEGLNKLHGFRIKITKTNGKYRSSTAQKYAKTVCQDAEDFSTPENRQVQNATSECRPRVRISQLKPYQLAPFVVVKRLNKAFMPDVTYRLTDINIINLLDNM